MPSAVDGRDLPVGRIAGPGHLVPSGDGADKSSQFVSSPLDGLPHS